MKKVLGAVTLIVLMASSAVAVERQVTFCTSYTIGDDAKLDGGLCDNKSIKEMYANGWHLIQMVSGITAKFGYMFEKEEQPAPPNTNKKTDKTKK